MDEMGRGRSGKLKGVGVGLLGTALQEWAGLLEGGMSRVLLSLRGSLWKAGALLHTEQNGEPSAGPLVNVAGTGTKSDI